MRQTSKQKNFSLQKHVKAWLFLFIIVLSSFASLPLFEKTANASIYTDNDPTKFNVQIKSLLFYGAMGWCMSNSMTSDNSLSLLNVQNKSWFKGNDVAVGTFINTNEGGVDRNGNAECDQNLITGSFAYWNTFIKNSVGNESLRNNVSSEEILFCNIATLKDGDKTYNGDACIEELGKTQTNPTEHSYKFTWDNNLKLAQDFRNFIKNKAYDQQNISLSDSAKYIYYRNSFYSGCMGRNDETALTEIAPFTKTDTSDYSDDEVYSNIKWVDVSNKNSETNAIEPIIRLGWYGGEKDKNTKVVIRSWNGLADGSDGGSIKNSASDGTTESCSTLATWMSNNAENYLKTYQAYVETHPENAETIINQTGNEDAKTVTSCAITGGLGWIVCPVVNFLAGIADSAFYLIEDRFLATRAEILSTDKATNSNTGTYDAWKNMRDISNVIFVIFFLIIIFSQTSSIGITNYGIKKLLPKLVVAAILVNISFFICQIAVDVSNIVGGSIKDLLAGLSPGGLKAWNDVEGGERFAQIALEVLGGTMALAAGTAVMWGSLSLLFPVLVAAVLAIVMILFILIARQAIIILLIVISPIAFVAYLLPNTEEWFKKWKKMFLTMLLVYPIVSVVFGASILASNILSSIYTDFIGQIIAAAVLTVPLFVVPGILKKSLDAVPAIGSLASKWSDKATGRVSGKAKEAYDDTAFARGAASRKQYKKNYRDTQYADRLSRGGITGLQASGFGYGTKANKFARDRMSSYATTMSDKLDEEAVTGRMAELKNEASAGDLSGIQSRFVNAMKNGDSVEARATARVLLASGGKGKDTLHAGIADFQENHLDPSNEQQAKAAGSVRKTILGSGIKGDDAVMDNWGATGKSLSAISSDPSTFKNLETSKLATQSKDVIKAAMEAGAISSKAAQAALDNPNTRQAIGTGDKLAMFEKIAASNIVHEEKNPNQPTLGF